MAGYDLTAVARGPSGRASRQISNAVSDLNGSDPLHLGLNSQGSSGERQRRSRGILHESLPLPLSAECVQHGGSLFLTAVHQGIGDPPQRLIHVSARDRSKPASDRRS